MRTEVNDALARAVLKFGTELGRNPRRCRAVLFDWCPRQRREIRALEAAGEEDVPDAILSQRATVPETLLIETLARKIFENRGIDMDLCRWAVRSWANALAGHASTGSGTQLPGRGAPLSRRRIKIATSIACLLVFAIGFYAAGSALLWRPASEMNGRAGATTSVDPNPSALSAGPRPQPAAPMPQPDVVLKGTPVNAWADPAYARSQAQVALDTTISLRAQLSVRVDALKREYKAAVLAAADTARLNQYLPRAFQLAQDENRWPMKASGYTLTRVQGERVIAGLTKYIADQNTNATAAVDLTSRLESIIATTTDLQTRLACLLSDSPDPTCTATKLSEETVEPLTMILAAIVEKTAALPGNPKFNPLDVEQLAGPP